MTAKRGRRGRVRRPRPARPAPEAAARESRHVDFKDALDINDGGAWCEVIKDIVAMRNSDGGALVLGVNNYGSPSGADCAPLLKLDTAKIVDKIAAYTDVQVAEFEIRAGERDGKEVAVIEIQGGFPPLVFVRAGVYEVVGGDGKKKTKIAFNAGTVYFRHGAKSEPANSHDLNDALERRLIAERRALLSNVAKVVHMPAGTEVRIVPRDAAAAGDETAVPFRLVDDPKAPVARALDLDAAYPFRQTELLVELNKRLADGRKVTGFDVQCVRREHGIDGKAVYAHRMKFGSRQYSQAFLDWLIDQHRKDRRFFDKVREAQTRARPGQGTKQK